MKAMREIVAVTALGVLTGGGVAKGVVVGANAVIPVPAPASELARWTERTGRVRIQLDVDGATLRGWEYRPTVGRSEAGLSDGGEREAGVPGAGRVHAGQASRIGAAANNGHGGAPRPVMVFFNGNLMTLERSEELYRRLAGLGADVIVYDYRGYGFSEGTADVTAFRRDALAIYDDAVRRHAGRRVMVYGFSLGTAMASYVASERKVAGVVLAAPFATAEKEMPVFASRMGFTAETIRGMQPGDDARVAFDEVGMMGRSAAPLLVLSGTADTLVPTEQSREVLEASGAVVKRMVELPGAQHYETAIVESALRAVRTFVTGLG